MTFNCEICGRQIGFQGICHLCKRAKERDEILALTSEQIEEKVQKILAHISQKGDLEYEMQSEFEGLLFLHDLKDERIARAALECEIYYPAHIYRGAPSDVRDELLARLAKFNPSKQNRVTINHILNALAIIGDDVVVSKFYEFTQTPPPWRKVLYVGADVYAHSGGWEIGANKERRSLVFDRCYALQKDSSGTALCMSVSDDICQNCGSPLVCISVDGNALGLGRLEFKFCLDCVFFAESSGFYKDGATIAEGESRELEAVDFDYSLIDGLNFTLHSQIPPFFGAFDEAYVTLGGMPEWVQDTQYFTCPNCGQTMKFVAQIPFGLIDEWGEGTLYLQACECGTTGVCYQCT